MKRGITKNHSKKAQFYIIAAVIIIALVITLTTISNYAVVKEPSLKAGEIFEDFNSAMLTTIDYCINNNLAQSTCVNRLTTLYGDYTQQNTLTPFSITIYYGNVSHEEISYSTVASGSSGTVSTGEISLPTSGSVQISHSTQEVFEENGNQFINVTINGAVYKTPVLIDNNFIAVMITTEQGSNGNTYVLTNQE